MMTLKLIKPLSRALLLSLLVAFAACEDETTTDNPNPPSPVDPIEEPVEQDPADRIVVRSGSEIAGDLLTLNQNFQVTGKSSTEFYSYKAYADQPVINGLKTEATSIVAAGSWLFVSWHTEASPYGGAISAYEKTGSGYQYVEVLEFMDTDWHDLAIEENGATVYIYAAGQRNPDSSGYVLSGHRGAIAAKINFNTLAGSDFFDLDSYEELALQGFGANGIATDLGDNSVLTVTGGGTGSTTDTSGVYRIPSSFENVTELYELEDGKFIERDDFSNTDRFYLAEQSGAALNFYAISSGEDLNSYASTGYFGAISNQIDLERNAMVFNGTDSVLVANGGDVLQMVYPSTLSNTITIGPSVLGLAHDATNDIVYAACADGGLFVIANPGYDNGVLINDYDVIGLFTPPTGNGFPSDFYVKDVAIYLNDNISIATGSAGVFFIEKQ